MIADPLELEVVSGGTVTVETPTDEVTVAADTPETIVLSTRTEGQGLPGGGTAGQALLKTTDDDFDADWGDIVGGTGSVDSVNGQTGVVVLVPADIDAASQADLVALADDLTTENGRAVDAEATLASGVSTALAAVTTEATARAAADSTLTTAVAGKEATGVAAGLIATEVTDRNTAIGVETSARTAADALLVPKTTTVAGHALSGNVTVSASDVGLGNVTNTSDANKPVSTAQQTALDAKVTGPTSATDGHLVAFDGTTGKLVKDPTGAQVRAALGTGTPSSTTALYGDGSWKVPTAIVRRRVVSASRLNTTNVQGTPLWPLGNAASTTIAIPLGGLYVTQADIDSQQTGVTLVVPITATSATGAQVLTIVGYAMDADGLPTGTPLFSTNVPAASTGNIASSTTVALPAQPFFVGVLNPSGNAGTVTVTATVPPTHTAWASATNTRSALTASSLASPPDVTTNGTTWTIDSSSTSTKWAVQASMPIVLGRA